MNNKNKARGFTLVEILGVVIILGIILGIASPSIGRFIKRGKQVVYNTHLSSMIAGAKSMTLEYLTNNIYKCKEKGVNCPLPPAHKTYMVKLKDMIDNNYIEPLENPDHKKNNLYCSEENSYVLIRNNSKQDGEYDLEYTSCLQCGTDPIRSKGKLICRKPSDHVCEGEDCKTVRCGEVISENYEWTNKDVIASVGCKTDDDSVLCARNIFTKKFKAEPNQVVEDACIDVYDSEGNLAKADKKCELNELHGCLVSVKMDTKAPDFKLKVEKDSKNWATAEAKVIFEESSLKDEGSGVLAYGLGFSKKPNYNFKKELKVENGVNSVYGYAKDKAGNETVKAITVKVDNQPPVITDILYGYEIYPKSQAGIIGNDLTYTKDTPSFFNWGRQGGLKEDFYGTKFLRNDAAINEIRGTHLMSQFGEIKRVRIYFSDNYDVSGISSDIYLYDSNNLIKNVKVDPKEQLLELKNINHKFSDFRLMFSQKDILPYVKKVEVFTHNNNEDNGLWTNQGIGILLEAVDTISGLKDYYFDGSPSKSPYKYFANNKPSLKLGAGDANGNISTNLKTINVLGIERIKPICSLTKKGLLGRDDWFRSPVSFFLSSGDSGGSNLRYATIGDNLLGNLSSYVARGDRNKEDMLAFNLDKAGNLGVCKTPYGIDTVPPVIRAHIETERVKREISVKSAREHNISENELRECSCNLSETTHAIVIDNIYDDRSGIWYTGFSEGDGDMRLGTTVTMRFRSSRLGRMDFEILAVDNAGNKSIVKYQINNYMTFSTYRNEKWTSWNVYYDGGRYIDTRDYPYTYVAPSIPNP